MKFSLYLLFLLGAFGGSAFAEESRVTLHSTVSGSQEQPRVMYIVPWQQPVSAEPDYELQSAISAELFSHVDRYEFNRAMAYRDKLNKSETDEGDNMGATQQDLQ